MDHLPEHDRGFAAEPADALLASYLAVVDEPLLLVDRRGRIVFCNDPARGIFGAAPTAGVGDPARTLLRRVRRGDPPAWHALVAALRAATSAVVPMLLDGRTTEVALHPLRDGWAVRVARGAPRGERPAGADANLDPLTGLPNRIGLHERFGAALERQARTGEGCAVLMVDLDRFKQVNDSLGHAVGDALLRTVADRLRSATRPNDTVARVGGDEFVIIQAAAGAAGTAEILAERLVDLVSRAYMVEGHLVSIGASVGIALAPRDGVDTDKLLRSADLALYRAKRDGRGTFRFFEPAMDALLRARRGLEFDLRKALALKEFELHYQPQLNLETDTVVGFEALLRWRHPTRGMTSPAEFVPLAEEIGLIVPLGEWVVRTACQEAARWPDTVSVAVNLSPAQFKSKRLYDTIVTALATSGLPARRLELEITEGVLMQENAATLATLHRLRDLGIRISMDDFGTGYSSLSYLRSFPFDKIKIDRSFIDELAKKPDSDAIIRAIAGLGMSLGMTTVAEGVETIEQMRRIRAEGCTDVQGYLISKPIPPSDILQLLSDRRRAAA